MNESIKYFLELYENNQRFVVFDVETVGCSQEQRIVEIGALEAGKKYSQNYKTFSKILQFRPESWKPFSRELRIHKIPTREIENGQDPVYVFRDFLDFIKDSILISHTAFDIRACLNSLRRYPEFQTALDWNIWKNCIDSCALARNIYPGLESYSLKTLAEHFKISNPQSHRALADAWTTKRIIAKLLQHNISIKKCTNN